MVDEKEATPEEKETVTEKVKAAMVATMTESVAATVTTGAASMTGIDADGRPIKSGGSSSLIRQASYGGTIFRSP